MVCLCCIGFGPAEELDGKDGRGWDRLEVISRNFVDKNNCSLEWMAVEMRTKKPHH